MPLPKSFRKYFTKRHKKKIVKYKKMLFYNKIKDEIVENNFHPG